MSWKTIVYERTKLYDEVWSKPICQVAADYGISDVALAKICKKLGVPRPGRGYWARKAAGQQVKKYPLPPKLVDQPEQCGVSRWNDPIDQLGLGTEAASLLARGDLPEWRIEVPDKLRRPHEWIQKSSALLRKHSKDSQVALRKQACIDVRASYRTLSRALLVADALLKGLERRGFLIDVTRPSVQRRGPRPDDEVVAPSRTGVHILGTLVEFAIWEKWDSIKIQPKPQRSQAGGWEYTPAPEYKRKPNGKLVLEIIRPTTGRSRRTWCDGKRQRVENCLNDFVVALIKCAERTRIGKAEEQRRRREWEEAERRREAEERHQELVRQRIEDLEARIEAWSQGRRTLEFLDHLSARSSLAGSSGEGTEGSNAWLAWARQRGEALISDALSRPLPSEKPLTRDSQDV